MDQSESFEPDKKRSARRPQQEQEGGSVASRRLRYQQQVQASQQQAQHPPGVAAARGQASSSYQQPTYGVSQLPQAAGYPAPSSVAAAAASSSDYASKIAAAMATTAYPAADAYAIQQEQQRQQQLLYEQQQQQMQQQQLRAAAVAQASYAGQTFPAAAAAAAAAATAGYPYYAGAAAQSGGMPHMPVPAEDSYVQPRPGRLPADRPLIKLSVRLIDTYKHINTVYYEERDARRKNREKSKGSGTNNNGWDDENYDYIITSGELFYGRYRIKERIGKGSFGQVVRAEDIESKREVAIKIIKSKKPFLMQAKTEIELLTHLWEKDQDDQHNVGKF